jgi:pyrimidine oxygenase
MAIPYVAGSYATIAAYLDGLVEHGIAGVCFIFPDYENDLQKVIDRVLPLRKYQGRSSSHAQGGGR